MPIQKAFITSYVVKKVAIRVPMHFGLKMGSKYTKTGGYRISEAIFWL